MLDEKAARRPTFDEAHSHPITLADGQSWWFPKPWLEFYPPDPGSNLPGAIFTLGPDFELAREAVESETEGAQITALFALARLMLDYNYELTARDHARLLRFRPNDEASTAMWQAIMDVATGNTELSPKPSGDGPGQPDRQRDPRALAGRDRLGRSGSARQDGSGDPSDDMGR